MRLLSALCFTALIGAAVPNYAAAQSALNVMDPTARSVQIQVVRQMVDAMGNLVDGDVTAPIASDLTADGGRLNAAIKPADGMAMVQFDPLTIGGGIMVNFTNGMFTEVSDQVTSLDPMTGAARISRMASGMITINVNVAGLMIMQPIMFTLTDFAATDMGPLFIADRAPRMPAMAMGMGAMNPAGMDFSNVAAGARAICAKDGSPFLMMMDLAIANCGAMITRTDPMTMMMTSSPAFVNPRQIDPKPFDPMTGEIRPVGVSVIRVAPFMIAGIPININPIVRFKLDAVQRITEGG